MLSGGNTLICVLLSCYREFLEELSDRFLSHFLLQLVFDTTSWGQRLQHKFPKLGESRQASQTLFIVLLCRNFELPEQYITGEPRQ